MLKSLLQQRTVHSNVGKQTAANLKDEFVSKFIQILSRFSCHVQFVDALIAGSNLFYNASNFLLHSTGNGFKCS